MANIITGCRILGSILLLFFPAFSSWFYFLYLFCGFTDMIDGSIARKTNSSSKFGARLDTVADFIFVMVGLIIATFVNALIITTIVDITLMGSFTLTLSGKCSIPRFVIRKDNRIDMQKGNECSGYSTAYILRHYDIPANGEEVYKKIPNKMPNGYVYPKEIKRILEGYGFHVKYCAGNLDALKEEVSKGNPVIVFMKVRKDKNWLHYVPVVGYDENHIFLAESLEEFVNCNEKTYNRKLSNKDFLALWNTSMIKMPLYTHTFYVIEKYAYH